MLIPSNKQPGASLKWPSRRAFVLNHMWGGCYSVDATVHSINSAEKIGSRNRVKNHIFSMQVCMA